MELRSEVRGRALVDTLAPTTVRIDKPNDLLALMLAWGID